MDNYKCPITLKPIFDPVILGQTIYEKDAIEDWVYRNATDIQKQIILCLYQTLSICLLMKKVF